MGILRREQFNPLVEEDDVWEATTRWANPGASGGQVFDKSGNLPHVAMTNAALRATRGAELEDKPDTRLGVGLLNGMPQAPLTEVPHYRGLNTDFDERMVQPLMSASPDLDLVTSEYGGGRGRGSLIRFEPGTPHRPTAGGSWGQWPESIVSGQFDVVKLGRDELTDEEATRTYDLNTGDSSPVYSARFKGHH